MNTVRRESPKPGRALCPIHEDDEEDEVGASDEAVQDHAGDDASDTLDAVAEVDAKESDGGEYPYIPVENKHDAETLLEFKSIVHSTVQQVALQGESNCTVRTALETRSLHVCGSHVSLLIWSFLYLVHVPMHIVCLPICLPTCVFNRKLVT